MSEVRQSEILIGAWRQRFVNGDCDLDEFEAGVDHALQGGTPAVADWKRLAHDQRLFSAWAASARSPEALRERTARKAR